MSHGVYLHRIPLINTFRQVLLLDTLSPQAHTPVGLTGGEDTALGLVEASNAPCGNGLNRPIFPVSEKVIVFTVWVGAKITLTAE